MRLPKFSFSRSAAASGANPAEAAREALPAAPIGESHTELPTPARRLWRTPRWSRRSVAPVSEHPEALPADVLAALDAASVIVRNKSEAESLAEDVAVERRPLIGLPGFRAFLFDEETGPRFLRKVFPELTDAQIGRAVRLLMARVIVEEKDKADRMEKLFTPQEQRSKWKDWRPYPRLRWSESSQQ
ncbi:hypothetical protein ACUXAV_000798 [Cupriavidus metallidurans]|jgi:hypothetical protein|uniref:hypothetical protein n=1 Tax=Cupriavidus TaxID=106589 RepID=UPI00049346C5|nr:hypothetical protein [Cupriavidus metallidurans]KWW37561.1 hypothetical protein AU374_01326 [Cupriavidus metallidurans]MDE4918699.1 hypothetical protein [Cupriavidus metallidurans]